MKRTTTRTAPWRRMQVLSGVNRTLSVIADKCRNLRCRIEQHLLLSLSLRDQEQSNVSETGDPPLPPASLREWVAGTQDIKWFLESGKRGEEAILSILGKHRIEFDRLGSVLDFGCGCGRVLRHLRRHTSVRLHGCDINRNAIAWCDEHFNFAELGTNRLAPPTRYRQHSFDLIYAFSVFTHLTQALQTAWMHEMRRILKPQGYLIITVHGDYYLPHIPEARQTEYRMGNLVVTRSEKVGLNDCAAFHPERYVRNTLANETGFKVIDFFPQGALGNPMQDAYLLQS